MTADELLKKWIYDDFRRDTQESLRLVNYIVPDNLKDAFHLYDCPRTTIEDSSHEWECGCYSEYTRHDDWNIHATISCVHGYTKNHWKKFYSFDVPRVLEEMFYLDEDNCPYTSDEYNF